MKRLLPILTIFSLLFSYGCSKVYYDTMESVGYDKREILTDRVEDARESQQDAKEEFASALDRFKSVVAFDGGTLEEKFNELSDQYDDCEDRAEAVSKHIDKVEDVAEALFDEWHEEIKLYSSDKLRSSSREKLNATKKKYAQLMKAMRKAESSMKPVLAAFQDQVLYLKHNLNAKAIAALEGELTSIRGEVDALIKEMDASIAEADQFIKTME